MTVDTETHGVIDHALRHRHLCDIAVTRRAIDLRTNVRRMIETDVGLFNESVDPLPRHVLVPLRVTAQRLDAGVRRVSEIFMAVHADIDAGNAGARALLDAEMTGGASDADIIRVNLVREIDRLLRFGSDVKEVPGGIAKIGVRSGEYGRAPSPRHVRIDRPRRILGYVGLLHATKSDRPKEQQDT
jgi:hypothetical protein